MSRFRQLRLWLLGVLVSAAVIVGSPVAVSAKVFASQQEALAEAFPDASRIDRQSLIIRDQDALKIEKITHQGLKARVVVIHVAYEADRVVGYAHIDVHIVRTQPEALMIVLTPDGKVRSVRMLAFHEPLDYLPTDRWYKQFLEKTKADALRVGRDVHGVVGATLSARAAADGVRRMLAYWEVLLLPAEAAAEEH